MNIGSQNPLPDPLPRPDGWLLFGSTGAVGGFVLQRLRSLQIPVLAVSRQRAAGTVAGVRWIHGSLEAAPELDHLLGEGWRPSVIACAGPLDAFSQWVSGHPPARGTRLLALSSLSADYKASSLQADERALAARLAAAESLLQTSSRQHGAQLTVLRAGLIYGTGSDRSLSPLLRLARRCGVLPWPRAADGLREPVHADDLAAALLAAADLRDLAPELLRLPGPERIGWIEMLRRSFSLEPSGPRLLTLPTPGLRWLAGRMATGVGRPARLAATIYRLHQDQCATSSDWALLGLAPRRFTPQLQLGDR
ncbi:nucleoside-diphosphate sugar epimerase [Aquimonas sp.]|jgi:nucleoside-diphosphate-sugar epimerase|uniref:nucleoside-diphosphate sugar epimerase n=1 Tax=Aquimonas sp. TaxID=1872588 RepID=UPI0037BF3B14